MTANPEDIPHRIEKIAPLLKEKASACVEARCVVEPSMRAMVEAGLFRISQPRNVGGYEMDLRTVADAVTAVSEACASSGWVLMVMAAHHFCLASFPESAQEEVFGGGRDGLVAGALSWQGRAKQVDGGYLVNGRWQFCSGVDRSNFVMLGCSDEATGAPFVHIVVPTGEIIVDDTWHVLGLEGTGSRDVVARDLFVPANRAIDTAAMMKGLSTHARRQATKVYRVSCESMLSLSVATAVLGSAKAALARFIERTAERRAINTAARKADHGPTQLRIAEASAEIKCAQMIIHDSAGILARVADSGSDPADIGYRATVKWQAAYAAELCRRAASRLYAGSGAHGVYNHSALQAAFRNVSVGAQHASIDFDSSGEAYGRMIFRDLNPIKS